MLGMAPFSRKKIRSDKKFTKIDGKQFVSNHRPVSLTFIPYIILDKTTTTQLYLIVFTQILFKLLIQTSYFLNLCLVSYHESTNTAN